jgi:hypothetical protein
LQWWKKEKINPLPCSQAKAEGADKVRQIADAIIKRFSFICFTSG